MKCARCSAELTPKSYEQVTVQSCGKCGGNWVGPQELSSILAHHETHFPGQLVQKTLSEAHPGISKAEDAEVLNCPQCSSVMHAFNYDYSSGVIVQVCPNHHGLWFDRDELEEVEIFMDHWNHEEVIHHEEWKNKLQAAEIEENAIIHKINERILKDISPTGFLPAIFHTFEKLNITK